jgi:hypothetical protein
MNRLYRVRSKSAVNMTVPKGHKPGREEIQAERVHHMFLRWLYGSTMDQIAVDNKISKTTAVARVAQHVKSLWRSHAKWRLAEIKCHAMSMELRLLRMGKEAQPDRPIETLHPPAPWLKLYKNVGIDTVNQLRAVDTETLLAHWRFRVGAIDWAILALDKLGLSHVLNLPAYLQQVRQGPPTLDKRIKKRWCPACGQKLVKTVSAGRTAKDS